MKVVGYLRVSTDRQAEEGLGLEVQERWIKAWAQSNGHRVVAWCRDEGVSGSNGIESRVGLLDALGAVEDGTVEGIVVYRLDRLARNLTVQEGTLAKVWALGGSVFAVDLGEIKEDDPDDPMRTALRQIVGVFAQLERGLIVKRMRDGRSQKRDSGGYSGDGAPPYGWHAVHGELVPVEDEQQVLKFVRKLRREGKSLRQIAERLTVDQVPPPRGSRWHPTTLSRMLARGGR